jgi:glycosyltransferase involved in cell wall biosynthesis
MEAGTDIPGRVALVHDFLLDVRGAERVFAVLCDLFPQADLFTAVYDERGTEGRFAGRHVTASTLQRFHPTARTFRALMPFYPYAIEGLNLRGYDLVLSSSSAWAHGVIPDERALHLCYCHNPFRYAWNAREETLARWPAPARPALSMVLSRWRSWDTLAARRVDRYIANSETTRRRIHRYYGREAEVLAPPVDTSRFAPAPAGEVGEDLVVLSELMPHKRLDLAVRACTALGLPLTVIGKGPDAHRLRQLAGPTVRFTGHLGDAEVAHRLARARALIVTATEEFGIAAVEAQASGRPVLALREGGALETVVNGVTGTYFDQPDVASLVAALRRFDADDYTTQACVDSARRFDVSVFRRGMLRTIREALAGSRPEPERAWARRRPPRRSRGLAAPPA